MLAASSASIFSLSAAVGADYGCSLKEVTHRWKSFLRVFAMRAPAVEFAAGKLVDKVSSLADTLSTCSSTNLRV